jgi:hypothetical protein
MEIRSQGNTGLTQGHTHVIEVKRNKMNQNEDGTDVFVPRKEGV